MIASEQQEIERFIANERYGEPAGRGREQQQYAIIEWLEQSKNTPEKFQHVLNLAKYY